MSIKCISQTVLERMRLVKTQSMPRWSGTLNRVLLSPLVLKTLGLPNPTTGSKSQ